MAYSTTNMHFVVEKMDPTATGCVTVAQSLEQDDRNLDIMLCQDPTYLHLRLDPLTARALLKGLARTLNGVQSTSYITRCDKDGYFLSGGDNGDEIVWVKS